MPSQTSTPFRGSLHAFSTSFRLSTAPPPPLDAPFPPSPEPKNTTTTAPGPSTPPTRLPTPHPLPATLSPLEPPPRLLPWHTTHAFKPDILYPDHPGHSVAFPVPPTIGLPPLNPATPTVLLQQQRQWLWELEWQNIYGPGSALPEFGPPPCPLPPRMRTVMGAGMEEAGMTGPSTAASQRPRWEDVWGPDTPKPTLYPPEKEEAWPQRPSAARCFPEIVARVFPLSHNASAEVGDGETAGPSKGRVMANAVSEEGESVAMGSRSGAPHGHGTTGVDDVPNPPPPASIAARRADIRARVYRLKQRARGGGERAVRLERQEAEERREGVRRMVGGVEVQGHLYGEGVEEAARERREGVWVGAGDGGDEGVRLRGGGCTMSRWLGEGREGRGVAVDESGGQGCGDGGVEGEEGGEGMQAEDEEGEDESGGDEEEEEEEEEVEWSEEEEAEEEEVEWSEEEEDDDHLSSSRDPQRQTSLSPPPAWDDDSDADFESDWDDEEEDSPFEEDMIWDEELGREIILVSSSLTTRDDGALMEVTEIHLDGKEVKEGA